MGVCSPSGAEAPGGPRIPGMPGGSRKSTRSRRIQGIAIPKRAAQAFPLPNGLSLIHKKLWNSFRRDVSEPEGKGFSWWFRSLFGMGGCASQKTEREFRSSFPNSGFGEQELRLGEGGGSGHVFPREFPEPGTASRVLDHALGCISRIHENRDPKPAPNPIPGAPTPGTARLSCLPFPQIFGIWGLGSRGVGEALEPPRNSSGKTPLGIPGAGKGDGKNGNTRTGLNPSP